MSAVVYNQSIQEQVRVAALALLADHPGRFTVHVAARIIAGDNVLGGEYSDYAIPATVHHGQVYDLLNWLRADGTLTLGTADSLTLRVTHMCEGPVLTW